MSVVCSLSVSSYLETFNIQGLPVLVIKRIYIVGLSKEFRVAGDAKIVRGGPTKHERHLTLIAASIILISFFNAGHHDFLFSTYMSWRDEIFCKCTKYHGNRT